MSNRYDFDLTRKHVWKDMFTWKPFWRMWGIRKTLKYMFGDTALELTRRANNGELFNKNISRDKKDSIASFFWRIYKKYSKGEER